MNESVNPRVLRRFRDGDPGAVRELYQAYALGDRSLAEEAVQQTFLQAWRASSTFDPKRDPKPWLYAIARRVAVDLFRRERRHQTSDTDDFEVAVLPHSFEGTWEAWQVRSALDQVPTDEREILHATHFMGLTHEETAERLGVPVGTVKSRSYRAHRRLAGLLSHLREATA